MQGLTGNSISEVLDQLEAVTSLSREVQFLHSLSESVTPVSFHLNGSSHIDEETVFETDLQHVTSVSDQEFLKLMPYLFNRRFAWKGKPQRPTSKKEHVQQEFISLLDNLIQW